MPLVDSSQKAVWDSLYSLNGGLHYERAAKDRILGNDHWRLKEALNLQPGQKIALIGAGFGWIAEDWIAAGLSVVATDTSSWIQANKGANATVTILNEGGLTNTSRKNILSALGLNQNSKFDVVITEDVLPILSDAECQTLGSALRQFAVKLVHWLSILQPGAEQDARLNWKTLEDWKALMGSDTAVQRGSSRVL